VFCFIDYNYLSIVLKWCTTAQAKWQCSMCPPPFLITAARRRRHSVIPLSMKRCEGFLPVGDYRSLQFFHRLELSLVKSTRNSVIHGINIRAIWRPHVRCNKVYVLFFSDSPSWSGRCALYTAHIATSKIHNCPWSLITHSRDDSTSASCHIVHCSGRNFKQIVCITSNHTLRILTAPCS